MEHPPLEARVRTLLAAGDKSGAATAVIAELGPGVLRYLRSFLRDEDDAADAFSMFAENVWKGLPQFRSDASIRTWAYRIAWNAAVNLKQEAWNRHRRRLATHAASVLAESIRTKSFVRVARQQDALERLRRALSTEEQSLLALRIDQGFSWAEVAEIMSSSGEAVQPGTLMKRFERLKERIAELARNEGLVD
jgi:RNA polymerase sigma-70 factor (ECF subfamily)